MDFNSCWSRFNFLKAVELQVTHMCVCIFFIYIRMCMQSESVCSRAACCSIHATICVTRNSGEYIYCIHIIYVYTYIYAVCVSVYTSHELQYICCYMCDPQPMCVNILYVSYIYKYIIHIYTCIYMQSESVCTRACVAVCMLLQPIADRMAQNLEVISETLSTYKNSVHGIYD